MKRIKCCDNEQVHVKINVKFLQSIIDVDTDVYEHCHL